MICLNGKKVSAKESLKDILADNGYKKDRIAVEINGQIIKRCDYDEIVINDGDNIEVVSFVGGG